MKFVPYQWPSQDNISTRYMNREPNTMALIGGHCAEEEDWRQRAALLDSRCGDAEALHAERGAVCAALLDYARRTGAQSAALANIERLADSRSLVIAGGQQTGLLGGPLLVIYKALTIIDEARQAELRLGRPVIPLFWLAGEDHDWQEVNHIHMQSAAGTVVSFTLPTERPVASSVSAQHVSPADWKVVLDELRSHLQQTEYTAELIQELEHMLSESDSLTVAFARLLHRLFAEQGLVLVDAADPSLRSIESEMFLRIDCERVSLHESFAAAKECWSALGLDCGVDMQERQMHLFLEMNGRRTPLFLSDEGFVSDRAGSFQIKEDEWHSILLEQPHRLSNNVLTRPLMQQYLFPVIGVVVGRSELAYWAMLPRAFAHFGWQMPLLVPRREFTLMEPHMERMLGKTGASFEQVTTSYAAFRDDWLRAQDTYNWPARFLRMQQELSGLYTPLIEQLATLNEGMQQLGQQNLGKILEQVQFLEKRTLAAHEQQHQTFLRSLAKLQDALFPFCKMQERVYNVIAYLNRHGERWIADLLDAFSELEPYTHHLVYLSNSKEETE